MTSAALMQQLVAQIDELESRTARPDHFRRGNSVWKIRRRDVAIHYFNPIPGAQMTAPKG